LPDTQCKGNVELCGGDFPPQTVGRSWLILSKAQNTF